MAWFAIGPTVEIADTWCTDTRWEFLVRRRRRLVADAWFERHGDVARLSIRPATALDAATIVEAYRVLARLAVALSGAATIEIPSLGGGESLREDGFARALDGSWQRVAALFTLPAHEKLPGPDSAYAQPFYLPWAFMPVDDDMVERAAAELRGRPSRRLLDLGCGSGKNAPALGRLTRALVSIDASIEATRRCAEILGARCKVVTGSALALPFGDAAFDCIVDIGCIHCVPRPNAVAALQEVARVLRPDGAFVSRMFKPRSTQWLTSQSFHIDSIGYTTAEGEALLRQVFGRVTSDATDDLVYYRALEPLAVSSSTVGHV